MNDTLVTELPDGRELAWTELGDPKGSPIIAFHGTPGSRRQIVLDEGPVRSAGVRLIAVDRPGYGHSSFHPGRRLTDWPEDVARLADHLGLDRFGVIGISGGGPHALVCASRLPGRVAVAGIISGVGPLSAPGDEDEMLPANVLISRVARRSTKPLQAIMAVAGVAQRRWPERFVDGMARQMPAPDAEILHRPEVREWFLHDVRHTSSTPGKAAAQDFELFTRDWGFRLQDITVPVHLWQGDVDRNVPLRQARRMAADIPGSALHEVAGAGHLMVIDLIPEILGVLRPLV